MSKLVPILLRDMMRPLRQIENEMRAFENEFFRPSIFNRPRYALKYPESEDMAIAQHKDKIQVSLDVEGFKPEEIKVRTLGDQNAIEIEAKHEERQDEQGFISRQFVRRFVLPKEHDLKDVVSNLSENGILTITAPKKPQALSQGQEKAIPVEHLITDKK